jgi:hypothetical protein
MNLTEYLNLKGNVINGKKLRPADLNLIAKLDAMGVGGLISGYPLNVLNPISGFTAALDPFIGALINWTFKVYSSYDPMEGNSMRFNGTKVAIGTYDRVRMLVLSIDSKAFINFLD